MRLMKQNHAGCEVSRSPGPEPEPGSLFPQTSWTLLRQASVGCASGSNPAITEFTDRYYGAVRAYIAAIVRNATAAEELTQQFFVTAVLSGRLLLRAERTKGSFRSYLKQAIRNFLIDEHRRAVRQKEHSAGSSCSADAFNRTLEDVADEAATGPDTNLLRAWGQSIVRMAIARAEAISIAKGQQVHFQLFARRFLSDADEPPGWKEIGATFNLDEKTARSRAETVVRSFRAALWDLIATDLGSETTFDRELRDLIRIL
jgi:DNA-directed RNA polymerase specialized sigma24 family protein